MLSSPVIKGASEISEPPFVSYKYRDSPTATGNAQVINGAKCKLSLLRELSYEYRGSSSSSPNAAGVSALNAPGVSAL